MASIFRGTHEKPDFTVKAFSRFLFWENDQAGLIEVVQKAGKAVGAGSPGKTHDPHGLATVFNPIVQLGQRILRYT